VLLLFTIPESPRFLVRHPERWDELRTLVANSFPGGLTSRSGA
jgi:hypothetical protein